MASWRAMTAADIDGVLHVADEVHPSLPESAAVFMNRLSTFPQGCLTLSQGDEIVGYAISHPIRAGQPPNLDCKILVMPPDADQYYIHDLAILPAARGRGVGSQCIQRLLAVGGRFKTICLVSVYGSAPFWHRFGFERTETDEALSAKIRGYGPDAVYMVRRNM